MPVPLRHGQGIPCAPGLLALPRARGPFPRATELLCDVGGYCWQQVEEGGPVALTHLEENQIGLKKEKGKRNLSSVQT